MKTTQSIAVVSILGFALIAPTFAVTLTFDELVVPSGANSLNIGNRYVSDGFQIVATAPISWIGSGFNVYSYNSPNWTGSAGLTYTAVGAPIELSSISALPFSVASIELSRGDSNDYLVPIRFAGTKLDGSQVVQTYQFTDSVHGKLERFVFDNSFQGLTLLSWQQGAVWHQFDNLTIITSVPEPGTALLFSMLLPFVLLIGTRRSMITVQSCREKQETDRPENHSRHKSTLCLRRYVPQARVMIPT